MRKSSEVQAIVCRGLLVLLGLGTLALLGGCGGSSKNLTPIPSPSPGATTNVVVVVTSTANDKLAQFQMAITSITLGDNAGHSVTLLNRPYVQGGAPGITEFMRLNGAYKPLATANVSQGTYTSATVKLAYCQFAIVTVVSGGIMDSIDAQGLCGQGTGNATVNLPSPITISGSTVALSFDLQVSQSYTVTANNYTITPVFTVMPIAISANPTNDQNGKFTGIDARIISVNTSGNSLVAETADGYSFTLGIDGNTAFQGFAGLSNLAAGTLVNLDCEIQPNGAWLAARVEVLDLAAVTSDFVLPISPASPAGTFIDQPLDCFPASGAVPVCESSFLSYSGTVFHVSGQFRNLQNLPFTPNFSSSSFVLGQNVSVASTSSLHGPGGLLAADITLQPQTLNGTVTAVSNSGGFSVYRVTLAPYAVIPTTQQLQLVAPFSIINNPTTMMVYADGNTQLWQSGSIAPGSLLRFRGLVFGDNGTLRMDCAEILDGVPE